MTTCIQYGILPDMDRLIPLPKRRRLIRFCARRESMDYPTLFSLRPYTISLSRYLSRAREACLLALAKLGVTYRRIAEMIGYTLHWVYRICAREGIRRYCSDDFVRRPENVRATPKAA